MTLRAALASALYEEPAAPLLSGWPRRVGLLALVAVGAVFSAARLPVGSWNVLWAEDAIVFLRGALTSGPGVVFEPYSGYLHMAPRLLAEAASFFPLSVAPTVVTLLAALSVGLLSTACYVFLETIIVSAPLRIAAWIAIVLLPGAGGEVLGNLANLHWYLLVAGFLAVLARSRTRSVGFAVVQGGVLALAISSDALGLLLVPLVAIRIRLLPVRRERFIGLAVALAAVAQLIGTFFGTVLGGNRQVSDSTPMMGEFLDFYSYRVVIPGFVGVSGTETLAEVVGSALPGIALAIALGGLLFGILRSPRPRATLIALALGSVGFAAIVDSLQWEWLSAAPLAQLNLGDRYSVVPTALFVSAALVAIDGLIAAPSSRRPSVGPIVGAIVLVAVLAVVAIDFRVWNMRENPESWTAALQSARVSCLADPESPPLLPIKPDFVALELPCDVLIDRVPEG